MARYNSSLRTRKVIPKRGFTVPNAYCERILHHKGRATFISHPTAGMFQVFREFYVNVLFHQDHTCWVRGKWVSFNPQTINEYYALPEIDETRFQTLRANINWVEIFKEMTNCSDPRAWPNLSRPRPLP